jgi:hypothetical protein
MQTSRRPLGLRVVLLYAIETATALLLAKVALSILPDFEAGLEPGVPLPVLTSLALAHMTALSTLPFSLACVIVTADALGFEVVRANREWGLVILNVVAVGTALILFVAAAAPYCALSFPEAGASRRSGPGPNALMQSAVVVPGSRE